MKRCVVLFICLLAASAWSAVNVFVRDTNGVVAIEYECTAGEVVRSFALDVSVDKGRIVGISDFFRGESKVGARGYGFFPAAFRDYITVSFGTNANWDAPDYTPLAVVADSPTNTLPGLNSAGVTLEFGGLWDVNLPAAVPGPGGTLCSLRISEGATVSVAANSSRGGVVAAESGDSLTPLFTGAFVQPPEIIGLALTNGVLTISFAGGELETATAITGPWVGTGDASGQRTDSVAEVARRFYRVRRP